MIDMMENTSEADVASFDAGTAVRLGLLVAEAYAMYTADPLNLTPAATASFPGGYRLAGWVTMQDFFFEGKTRVFYGLMAQDLQQPERFVLAIRGTSTWVEWWDDLISIELVPFGDPSLGRAGRGFVEIYETLEVLENAGRGSGAAVPLGSFGGFSRQIAELTRRTRSGSLAAPAAGSSIEVAGHSLGSALATLYVQDNSQHDRLPVPTIYTFASPRVGDGQFAALFDALPTTSWRIANDLDVVTWVPAGAFRHVTTLKAFVPWNIALSVSCMHALTTYLSLVDPELQPDPACQLAMEQQSGV